jgi:hypothetical protein
MRDEYLTGIHFSSGRDETTLLTLLSQLAAKIRYFSS